VTAQTTEGANLLVRVNALTWANEISWNVDGGQNFGP
jgi:hypothetical protein